MAALTARAVVMTGARSYELRELAVPDAPPLGGAIVRVLANGICGSDWDLYSGALALPAGRPAPFPVVPGHEVVGRVVAIDADAAAAWNVRAGDRVAVESRVRCGDCRACREGRGLTQCARSQVYSLITLADGSGLSGGMAEYMVLRPGSSVFAIPDGVSDLDAALFNPLGNAFHWTLETGGVRAGDRVLVLGCGQRGLSCAVAAAEAGAAQVIVTGRHQDAHKLALAPSFGATAVIDVEAQDTVGSVRELTAGEGVDVAVDTVPEAVGPVVHAFESLRVGGRLVLAGVRGHAADRFPLDRIRTRQLTVVGVSGTTAWAVTNAVRVLAAGEYPFARLHTHTVGLEGAEDAVRTLGGELPGAIIHATVVP